MPSRSRLPHGALHVGSRPGRRPRWGSCLPLAPAGGGDRRRGAGRAAGFALSAGVSAVPNQGYRSRPGQVRWDGCRRVPCPPPPPGSPHPRAASPVPPPAAQPGQGVLSWAAAPWGRTRAPALCSRGGTSHAGAAPPQPGWGQEGDASCCCAPQRGVGSPAFLEARCPASPQRGGGDGGGARGMLQSTAGVPDLPAGLGKPLPGRALAGGQAGTARPA